MSTMLTDWPRGKTEITGRRQKYSNGSRTEYVWCVHRDKDLGVLDDYVTNKVRASGQVRTHAHNPLPTHIGVFFEWWPYLFCIYAKYT